MYEEVDIRFRNENISLREKLTVLANTYEMPLENIWNEYGKYGSEHSNYSPFNEYASNPPVIVDKQGNFYGYFTVNKFKSKRANFDLVNIIYEYYEEIREDVGEWYDKIF